MPIVDVELVCAAAGADPPAQALADALGPLFGAAPGGTWLRCRLLPRQAYAEDGEAVPSDALPVFVTVLLAHWPAEPAWTAQMQAVTRAVAGVLGCDPQRVHVQYAPPAAGRMAFGGRWVQAPAVT